MARYLLLFCFLMSLTSYADIECQLAEVDMDGVYGPEGAAYIPAIKIQFDGCSKPVCFMDISCTINGEKMIPSSAVCQPLEDGTCPAPAECYTKVNGVDEFHMAQVNTQDAIITPRARPLGPGGKVRRQ